MHHHSLPVDALPGRIAQTTSMGTSPNNTPVTRLQRIEHRRASGRSRLKTVPTKPFVDIEGEKTLPGMKPGLKCWDEEYFYIAAELEEKTSGRPTANDAVIYQKTTSKYSSTRMEIPTITTNWRSMPWARFGTCCLRSPTGTAAWYQRMGHLPRPEKRRSPIGHFERPCGYRPEVVRRAGHPWKAVTRQEAEEGHMEVNFSRVEWRIEEENGNYQKRLTLYRKSPSENNWVWSPRAWW